MYHSADVLFKDRLEPPRIEFFPNRSSSLILLLTCCSTIVRRWPGAAPPLGRLGVGNLSVVHGARCLVWPWSPSTCGTQAGFSRGTLQVPVLPDPPAPG